MIPIADLSHHQGDVDFHRMAAVGIAGVVLRVGDGGFTDRRFHQYADGARNAGLPIMLYIFCRPNRPAGPQVEALYEGDRYAGGTLCWWLDMEDHGGRSPNQVLAFLQDAVAIAETINIVGIYTGDYWWAAHIPQTAWADFKYLPLWQARYPFGYTAAPTKPRPDPDTLPDDWEDWAMRRAPAPVRGWDQWAMWQFSSAGPGTFYGASSAGLDLNLMRPEVWRNLTGGHMPDTIPVLSPGSMPVEGANMIVRVPNAPPVDGRWPHWACTGEHVIAMNGAPRLEGMDEAIYGMPAVRLPAGHARVRGVCEPPANMGQGIIVVAEDGGTFTYLRADD